VYPQKQLEAICFELDRLNHNGYRLIRVYQIGFLTGSLVIICMDYPTDYPKMSESSVHSVKIFPSGEIIHGNA